MIEVYSMVVFRERTADPSPEAQVYLKELRHAAVEAERRGEKGEAKLFRRDVRVLESEGEEVSYHFCRVRLVQPVQRGARVPVPKWEVVDDHIAISSSWQDRMADWPDFWERVVVEPRLPIPYFQFLDAIDDRRVTLTQIRFLHPETRTMPMFAALDYVRDRI